MTDTQDDTPLMPGRVPAPQRDPDWVAKHGGPVNGREPCGESGCICYGEGPEHADCACGCDCRTYWYEDDEYEDDEDWRPGECDNCYGDTGESTSNRPEGWTACACAIGKGADPGDCRCGPPADPEALEREREIQRHA